MWQIWDKYEVRCCSAVTFQPQESIEGSCTLEPQRAQILQYRIQKRQIKSFDLILKHLEIRRLSDAIVQPQQLTIDLAFQTCCNNNNLESLHVCHVDKIVPTHVYLPAGTYRLTLTIYSSFQRRLTQPQTVKGREQIAPPGDECCSKMLSVNYKYLTLFLVALAIYLLWMDVSISFLIKLSILKIQNISKKNWFLCPIKLTPNLSQVIKESDFIKGRPLSWASEVPKPPTRESFAE